jgi:hypothetical protein
LDDQGVIQDAALDATPAEDAAIEQDAEPLADAVVIDTGVPSHCPVDVNPTCNSAAQCGADIAPPTNCDTCVPSNLSLCVNATCETPPPLDLADIYAVATTVNPTVPLLESIAGFLFASRTAGDAIIGCADLYAGSIDFADRCYNVLDSKSINVSQTGDTYTFSFNGFASGQHTLFILYGHESTGAGGPPVGVSCTEIDVGPPSGGMSQFFAGDDMRPL